MLKGQDRVSNTVAKKLSRRILKSGINKGKGGTC